MASVIDFAHFPGSSSREQTGPSFDLISAKTLLDVQEFDHRLAEQRDAYRRMAVELKAEAGLPSLRAEAETARVKTLETRVQHSRLLNEVASLRERLQQIETRLYSGTITNMRELTALQEEQNTAKRNLAQAEESVGPAATASQEANRAYEEKRTDLAKREDDWKAREANLKAESQALARTYKRMERDRNATAARVKPEDLAVYNSILKRKEGLAVVRVERGICQCPRRLKLPLRETAKLKDTEALVTCSSCGRILLAT
jgi:predicted  nucleic acid-binding Zn-ribbon protein